MPVLCVVGGVVPGEGDWIVLGKSENELPTPR